CLFALRFKRKGRSERNKIKNADCICNMRMQSAFVNQLALNNV
ncbi:hypothetical protein HMPREF3216_01159, partial [Gardnerella vaginalis]